VKRADEPEADFCRGEKDADEYEGEGGYPASRNRISSWSIEFTSAK